MSVKLTRLSLSQENISNPTEELLEKERHVIEFRQIEKQLKSIPKPCMGRGGVMRNSGTSDIYREAEDIYESAKDFMKNYYGSEKEHVGIRAILHEFERTDYDVDYEGSTRYNNLETDTYFYENDDDEDSCS